MRMEVEVAGEGRETRMLGQGVDGEGSGRSVVAGGGAGGLGVLVKSADSGGGHCSLEFSHCPWEPRDLRKSPVLSVRRK